MNKPWTSYDIEVLLKYIREKRSLEYISKKQNRPLSSIRSKLKSIAATMYFKDNISFEIIYETTGISKESIILIPSRNIEIPDIPPSCIEQEAFEYKMICDHIISTFKICANIAKNIHTLSNASRSLTEEQ
jgi:hypothetical protein